MQWNESVKAFKEGFSAANALGDAISKVDSNTLASKKQQASFQDKIRKATEEATKLEAKATRLRLESVNFTKAQAQEAYKVARYYEDGADKLREQAKQAEKVTDQFEKLNNQTRFFDGIMNSLQNGYNQKISGDVMMIPYPATLIRGRTGTSHGSGYSYDTHIPLIFYGNGIKKGVSKSKYEIIDIAPTIANLLRIEAPNSSTGKIITEALK